MLQNDLRDRDFVLIEIAREFIRQYDMDSAPDAIKDLLWQLDQAEANVARHFKEVK